MLSNRPLETRLRPRLAHGTRAGSGTATAVTP